MNTALWRVFVPTWRFFDRIDVYARVFVAIDGGPWRPARPAPRRRWFNLFWNPAGNVHHADANLIARLLQEAAVADDVGSLTSYQILVRRLRPGDGPWRFKIVVDGEDVLVSPAMGGSR